MDLDRILEAAEKVAAKLTSDDFLDAAKKLPGQLAHFNGDEVKLKRYLAALAADPPRGRKKGGDVYRKLATVWDALGSPPFSGRFSTREKACAWAWGVRIAKGRMDEEGKRSSAAPGPRTERRPGSREGWPEPERRRKIPAVPAGAPVGKSGGGKKDSAPPSPGSGIMSKALNDWANPPAGKGKGTSARSIQTVVMQEDPGQGRAKVKLEDGRTAVCSDIPRYPPKRKGDRFQAEVICEGDEIKRVRFHK